MRPSSFQGRAKREPVRVPDDDGLYFWPGPRYNNPAPRAHLYFAPNTATGISVEYA